MENLKVIFHINASARWPRVLANVGNFLQACPEAQIEVLVNGEAVAGWPVQDMEKLALQGVQFVACRNSLRGAGIPEASLRPWVEVVPSGVVELAAKQAAGYAYIKP